MIKIGAHLSAGDSVLEAGKAAKELGLEAVQLFLTSPVQLQKMEIDNDEATEYRRLYGYLDTVVHGPFTLNPANPGKIGRKFTELSLVALAREAIKVGSRHVVLHSGSNPLGMRVGLDEMKDLMGSVLRKTRQFATVFSMETDVGGGSRVGGIGALRSLILTMFTSRMGICIDTAHMYGAGVDFAKEGVLERLELYAPLIDIVHINEPEPKVKLGGHLDRHNNRIGTGPIGKEILGKIAQMFKNKILIVECRDRDATKYNVEFIRSVLKE